MSSRRYIKRVWRVPKDRGATEYLATLIVKALVKHGWPATWKPMAYAPDGFLILYVKGDEYGYDAPPDFAAAVQIAVRIVARTYRVDVTEDMCAVYFNKRYEVAAGGHFRELKDF